MIAHRGGDNNDLELEGIDDVRNGLLLRMDLHRKIGDAHVAFLKVDDSIPFARCSLVYDLFDRLQILP